MSQPMLPEERDRLARLEVITENQQKQLDSIERKLDRLLDAAAMGRGAWVVILKVGGVLTMAAGAAAWVWDHFKQP